MKLVARIWTLAAFVYFGLTGAALAATVHSSPVLVFQSKQTWVLIIGSLVPLVTYVLNHVGPWLAEPIKAFVLVLVSAAAGGLYTALATTSFGWNSATLQMVLTAVIAALGAHHWLWKPSTVSARLGAGSNSVGHHLVWAKNEPQRSSTPTSTV